MQIGYVKGVDLSENEILEAQKRYNDAKLERTGTPHLSTQACSLVVQESVQHVHAHHTYMHAVPMSGVVPQTLATSPPSSCATTSWARRTSLPAQGSMMW